MTLMSCRFERAEAEQYMRESQKILRENAEARA